MGKNTNELLRKALHKTILKAYKSGNKLVKDALDQGNMSPTETQLNEIVEDLSDNNDVAEVDPGHEEASPEAVLHKDQTGMSVSEVHAQKQANAEAAMGKPPVAKGDSRMGDINMSEGSQKILPLKKFLDNRLCKKGKC